MIILGRDLRQLDHGCRPVEDLAAAIQSEMVMSSNKCKRDRQLRLVPLGEEQCIAYQSPALDARESAQSDADELVLSDTPADTAWPAAFTLTSAR